MAGRRRKIPVYYGQKGGGALEGKLDPAEPEVRVVIHAPAVTEEVRELLARLEPGAGLLPGFRGTEVTPLDPLDILRCYGEDKGVFAQTETGTYQLRLRLYELERRLPALDLSLTGTIRMTLTGGVTVYVSHRYVKKIREVLGL